VLATIAFENCGKFPSEVEDICDAGVETMAAGRGELMRYIYSANY
jgi:hypothetical protein